jgi:SPP1 gp7 family putative phage head morphogenesis protein
MSTIREDVNNTILSFLRRNEILFVRDVSFAVLLKNVVTNVRDKYKSIEPIALSIATEAIQGETRNNLLKFDQGMEKITGGVSLSRILSEENIAEIVELQIANNVELIQNMTDDYLKRVSFEVYNTVTRGDRVESLVQRLRQATKVSENRAKLIARDQIQKTNALITSTRQQQLGITEYMWQTAGDGPPRTRASHWSKQGKIFKWSEPPKDTGHPGNDINCRCIARAVIEL